MDIRAIEIIQTWKQVSTGKDISIRRFLSMGDKKDKEKETYC